MVDYPIEFEFDVLLEDGEAIRIRPIRPDDARRTQQFLNRLGSESAFYPFLDSQADLQLETLRDLIAVDYDTRMALVATIEDEVVAVGGFDLIEDESTDNHRVAELAFVVEESHRSRGIGRLLLQHLTVYARSRRIGEFEASFLSENVAMMRLFRNSGYRIRRQLDNGVYRVEFPTEYSIEAREADWEHEKRAATASLTPLLSPRSVAVIGASRDPASIGGRLLRNILLGGFTGPVYPVNKRASVVHSIATHRSVLDIADDIDLALVAVPRDEVNNIVDECGRKGVRGVVIISAGFSEVGNDALEQETLGTARRYGMRMIGPNCMGVLNSDPTVSLDAQFGPTFPRHGNVAMSSQSGALGLAILEEAAELGVGISTFVSLGNRADVSASDLLLYWEDDPATDVILLYMESFGNPRRFGRIAHRVSKRKPIIVVKAGRSSAGARAAASHTGSMASLDVAVDALFKRAGVVRTNTLHELFEVTTLLANQPIPAGSRVGVLTNAGGPGILAADALEGHALELPVLSHELQAELDLNLPAMASTRNPVDMIASAGPEQYRQCLRLLLESDEVDAVIVIYIPTDPARAEQVPSAIRETVAGCAANKPTVGVFMGSSADTVDSTDAPGLPVFTYPESAARALAASVRYGRWREKEDGGYPVFDDIEVDTAAATVETALRRMGDDGGWLNTEETRAVLSAYQVPMTEQFAVDSEQAAVDAAVRIGGQLAVKVIAPSVVHKSDVGGVVLGVSGEEEVRAAYRQVTAVAEDGDRALIQRYVDGGHEVIMGMTEDPLFGPLMVFGLGGIFVELMKDVSFRINPLTDVDAREMLAEVKSAKLLEGYRGEIGGDLKAAEELMLRLSALVENNPAIAELDLNPVKILPPGEGVMVVDARLRVRRTPGLFLPGRRDIPGRML